MSGRPKCQLLGCIWPDCEAMAVVNGAVPAELQGEGSLDIEFANHRGDEATLNAARL